MWHSAGRDRRGAACVTSRSAPLFNFETGATEEFIFVRRISKIEKKTIISLVMSVRLSVSMEKLGSQCTDFYEICYFNIFRESV